MLTPSCFSQTERLTSLRNVETETAAFSVSTLRNDVRRFLSLRYVMTSNVPFEKNKMASTLAVSVITTWSVHKMQGG